MTPRPLPWFRCAALAIAAAWPSAAWCDVIEIAPNGAHTLHRGPAVTTPEGSKPLILEATPTRSTGATPPQILSQTMSVAGAETALSPRLLEAVAWAESRFRQNAVSPKGAIGVMQLMPGTAAELGVDPQNPEQNVRGGALYLRRMLEEFGGDIELALAAYNAGPAAVRRYGGVPPFKETRAYVAAVMNYLAGLTTEAEEQ